MEQDVEIKNTGLRAVLEGSFSPPLLLVVANILDISENETDFHNRLEHSLEKLTAEIGVMQMELSLSRGEYFIEVSPYHIEKATAAH